MASNNVTKCVCHDRLFTEVKEYAEKEGLSTVEQLQNHNFCSNSCGLCIPYIEMMLETGQTVFSPGEPYRTKRRGE